MPRLTRPCAAVSSWLVVPQTARMAEMFPRAFDRIDKDGSRFLLADQVGKLYAIVLTKEGSEVCQHPALQLPWRLPCRVMAHAAGVLSSLAPGVVPGRGTHRRNQRRVHGVVRR